MNLQKTLTVRNKEKEAKRMVERIFQCERHACSVTLSGLFDGEMLTSLSSNQSPPANVAATYLPLRVRFPPRTSALGTSDGARHRLRCKFSSPSLPLEYRMCRRRVSMNTRSTRMHFTTGYHAMCCPDSRAHGRENPTPYLNPPIDVP